MIPLPSRPRQLLAPSARRILLPTLALVFLALFTSASSAEPTHTPRPAWSILSVAGPTNFTPGDESGQDTYRLDVTNTGSTPTNGEPVTITDTLPAGVTAMRTEGFEARGEESLSCSEPPTTQCTYNGVAPAGDVLRVTVYLKVEKNAPDPATNLVSVTGGGAPAAASSVQNPISTTLAPFAINDFSFETTATDGTPETQAGGHPYALTTTLDFNTETNPNPLEAREGSYVPAENAKDVVVDLPLGYLGNALSAPRCPLSGLELREGSKFQCPANTKIGEVTLRTAQSELVSSLRENPPAAVSPIYNLVPEAGHPAEFGFAFNELVRAHLFPSVVRTSSGYVLRVTTPNIPTQLLTEAPGFLDGVTLTFFGDPAVKDNGGVPPAAFFTNPVDCSAGQQAAVVHLDTWTRPGRMNPNGTPDFSDPNWAEARSQQPPVTGCQALQFHPTITLSPSRTQADSPTGMVVAVQVPQAPNNDAVIATPELKDATISLPPGLSLSPAAANGLEACTPTQFDLADNSSTAACPDGSKIGEVEVLTPLLEKPLRGHLFVAQPKCGGEGQPACSEASATNGELFGLYLQVGGEEGESTGIIVKLEGTVSASPTTGQLTTSFKENPQLPFSELRIRLDGGERAPLANPQSCGIYAATSDLVPWSSPATPDATPSSPPFTIAGCPAAIPFSPAFSAGTVTPAAGRFSPFVTTFSRHDGEQDLSGITVGTPPGLLGRISGVPLCQEPQAAQGTCSAASQIGTATAEVGAGSQPLSQSGPVYLTGPYKGQPFGLSIVTPAKAGPFNLGNVIVRASIHVDPNTTALTVTSDPLPQIIDGVPLRIQTVNVTINRAGFTFNPTNCSAENLGATIASTQGSIANVSSPFQAANCANLPFKPQIAVSTAAVSSKAEGASLNVKISSKGGPAATGEEANIRAVKVDLPEQLPSRLTTLQKACLARVFAANPAGCPKESKVGTATVHTPVLANPLTGRAYLVSHGGAAFPDLEIVLEGEGITLVLDGKTAIKHGITSSTFRTVPDAPISSFELNLPTGPYSILSANLPQSASYNFCGQTLNMPTAITGQNGAEIHERTRVGVSGCGKPQVRIRHTKDEGDTVLVTVTTSQPGTVRVTGNGLKTLTKTLGAGTQRLRVALTASGRNAGKLGRTTRIKVSVKNTDGSTTKTKTAKL